MHIIVEFTSSPDQYSKEILKETKKEWGKIKRKIAEYKVLVRMPSHKEFVDYSVDYYRICTENDVYLQVVAFAKKLLLAKNYIF